MVGQKNAAFAEESAEVEVLLATFNKTTDLTKRIKASLTRLDNSGKVVKDAIGPINSGTQQLQLITNNITRINEAIERLRQPIDSKAREETIIRSGPQNAGLQQYLGALRRIDRAITDLSTTNIRSNQQAISEFHTLLSTGVDQLLELYRQTLEEDAAKIEPLYFTTRGVEFPTYSLEKVTSLGQVASAIVAASVQSERLGRRDDDPAVKIYSSIRGDYIADSLQVAAMSCISTSKRRTNDTSIYKRDQNGVGMYTKSLEGMLIAEYQNISRIFRGEVADRVFAETSSKAMSNFAKTLSELNGIIKSRIMTDCFLAYEILEIATPTGYKLESRTGQLKSQISDAIRPIRETARSSLSEILNQTKAQADGIATLPFDGNTIPLVRETAARLQALAQFDKTLSYLLTSVGENGWRKDPSTLANASSSTLNLELAAPSSSESGEKLLSSYLSDVLDTFLVSLAQRSLQIHRANRPVQGIFMLNTLAVLNHAITTSPELTSYIPTSPTANPKLEGHRKTANASALSSWRDPSSYLFDQIPTSAASRPMSGQAIDSTSIVKSLNSKDKDKIKEKFRSFNVAFDDLLVKHRAMFMEKEVKNHMSREVQGMIEPLYARFWDRYHEVDKGKGKVVKYSKGELAALLASL